MPRTTRFAQAKAALTVLLQVTLLAASAFAGMESVPGMSFNFSGRNSFQCTISHNALQFVDGTITVKAGDVDLLEEPLQIKHRNAHPVFGFPNPLNETLFINELPAGQELTVTFDYKASGTLSGDTLVNPSNHKVTATGTLGVVSGRVRANSGIVNNELKWEGGTYVLARGRFDLDEGITLSIKNSIVTSETIEPDIARADILASGANIIATNTYFLNLSDINLNQQDPNVVPLFKLTDCQIKSETFFTQFRASECRFEWDGFSEDHSSRYTVVIPNEGDPLPTEGVRQVVLHLSGDLSTLDSTELRIRIFDGLGNMITDAEEADMRFNPRFFKSDVRNQVRNGTNQNLGEATRLEFAEQAFQFSDTADSEGLETKFDKSMGECTITDSHLPVSDPILDDTKLAAVTVRNSTFNQIMIGGNSGPSTGVLLSKNSTRGIQVFGGGNTILDNTIISQSFREDGLTEAGTGLLLGITDPARALDIFEDDSSFNTITGNRISGFSRGLELRFANDNTIQRNTVEHNRTNLVLHGHTADGSKRSLQNNLISDNIFRSPRDAGNQPGLNFLADGHCAQEVCPNRFNEGTISGGPNVLDGPVLAGNFWDDYQGVDADANGVGDSTNLLSATPRYEDTLPLVPPPPPRPTLIVNVLTDDSDADPDDNVADTDLNQPGLQTSLRSAIEFANANEGPFTIEFEVEGRIDFLANLEVRSEVHIIGNLTETGAPDVATTISPIRFLEEASQSSIEKIAFGNVNVEGAQSIRIREAKTSFMTIKNGGSIDAEDSDFLELKIEDSPGSVIGRTDRGNEIRRLKISGTASDSINIIGNEFVGVSSPDATNFGENNTLILLRSVPNIVIEDNSFSLENVGITLTGADTKNTSIKGNRFEDIVLGVLVEEGAQNNMIGGTEEGSGNTFSGYSQVSQLLNVCLGVSSGQGNHFIGNAVNTESTRLIVDLAFDPLRFAGATPNDDDTANTDPALPNRLLNKPEILLYPSANNDFNLIGFFRSRPNHNFQLEVFTLRDVAPIRQQVRSDSTGLGVFSVKVEEFDDLILATITDQDGNTSESSELARTFVVNSTGDSRDSELGDGLNQTGSTLPGGEPETTLRATQEEISSGRYSPFAFFNILFQIGSHDGPIPRIDLREELTFISELGLRLGGTLDVPNDVSSALGAIGVGPEQLASNPMVEINGSALTGTSTLIAGESGDIIIDGVQFSSFPTDGLNIENCFSAIIRNCHFVDNKGVGLSVVGTSDIIVKDSFFGISTEGEQRGNATGLKISGDEFSDRGRVENNTIGANSGNGLVIENGSNFHVVGNHIGILPNGTKAPNGTIFPDDSRVGSGIVLSGVSPNNFIGGLEPGAGNHISANFGHGIVIGDIADPGADAPLINHVLGNRIGEGGRNGASGLRLSNAATINIGGSGAAGNLFKNELVGIENGTPLQPGAETALIRGNRFESCFTGIKILDTKNSSIGGPSLLPIPNTFNSNDICVQVIGATSAENVISRNSMFSNLAGIELVDGSNEGIQAPIVRSARHKDNRLHIDFAIRADKINLSTEYKVEVFRTPRINKQSLTNPRDLACDQGKTFVGEVTFQLTDARIHFVTASLPLPASNIGDEDNISATVTVPKRGTSEFSNCYAFVANDGDGDGTADSLEAEAVGDGDFNNNGTPDTLDSAVGAVQLFEIDGSPAQIVPVAVKSPESDPENPIRVRGIRGFPVSEAQVPVPPGVEFPFGLMEIDLEVTNEGDSVTVTLPLPDGFDQVNCYYKLVRKLGNAGLEWVCYDDAKIETDTRRVMITLTDGEVGDIDLVVDRIIRDPGGLAFDPNLPPLGTEDDIDGDGLPNTFEEEFFGSPTGGNPRSDSDNDGTTEFEEAVFGTNPLDASDVFKITITRSEDGRLSVSFPSKLGREYTLQSGPQLEQFSDFAPPRNGTGETITIDNVELPGSSHFVRVKVNRR